MNQQKQLVLSLGANYQYYHLEPIFKSLSQTSFRGDFVFFYNGLSKDTLTKLKRYPSTLIPFKYDYPYVEDKNIVSHLTDPPDFTPHPKTLRYILYNAYLKAYKNKYSKVFIGDCRDLIFQKGPFDDFELSGLHCFEEDRNQLIGTNRFNSSWIKEAFGTAVLNKIKDKPILCSGTTYGLTSSMIYYTEEMINIIKEVRDQGCKDQGIHNYLIHFKEFGEVTKHKDDEAAVSTISSFKPIDKIYLSSSGLILNHDEKIINVVHQYDRYWKLLWKYNKTDFILRKTNYLKQFVLAVWQSKRIKKRFLSNLRSIISDPMTKKYDWS